jgi:hypothetical protein
MGPDRGHRRAPPDPEIPGHRRNRSTVLADPTAHLGAGPLSQDARATICGQISVQVWSGTTGADTATTALGSRPLAR